MKSNVLKKLVKASQQYNKLQHVPNPTMSESFGENFSKELANQYLNPRGTIYESTSEKTLNDSGKNQNQQKKLNQTENQNQQQKINQTKEEYGFKYEGKEPTRFGDWEHKGRCTDF